MPTNSEQPSTSKALRAPRRIDGMTPKGCKSISVIVEDKIYFHVQTQAALSCLDMPDYLYNLLREAVPLQEMSRQLRQDE